METTSSLLESSFACMQKDDSVLVVVVEGDRGRRIEIFG
jgi:uncharacterized membrane protein YgcG